MKFCYYVAQLLSFRLLLQWNDFFVFCIAINTDHYYFQNYLLKQKNFFTKNKKFIHGTYFLMEIDASFNSRSFWFLSFSFTDNLFNILYVYSVFVFYTFLLLPYFLVFWISLFKLSSSEHNVWAPQELFSSIAFSSVYVPHFSISLYVS